MWVQVTELSFSTLSPTRAPLTLTGSLCLAKLFCAIPLVERNLLATEEQPESVGPAHEGQEKFL